MQPSEQNRRRKVNVPSGLSSHKELTRPLPSVPWVTAASGSRCDAGSKVSEWDVAKASTHGTDTEQQEETTFKDNVLDVWSRDVFNNVDAPANSSGLFRAKIVLSQ